MSNERPHYRFAMGEHDGKECYIVQSAKGLEWLDVSAALESLLRTLNHQEVLDFSVGCNGNYRIKWRTGGKVCQMLSDDLLLAMRVNGHNSIDHLTIGPGKQYWGITQGAATTFAKDVWKGLNKTKKKKGPLVGVSVPFVTLGAAGQFSYRLRNSSPTAIHDYVQDSRLRVVVNLAAKRRKKVLRVVLSSKNAYGWLVLYDDATYDATLPVRWHSVVDSHFNMKHSLQTQAHGAPVKGILPSNKSASTSVAASQVPALWPVGLVDNLKVHSLFDYGWQHSHKRSPITTHIYSINVPATVMSRYDKYRLQIVKQPSSVNTDEERQLFHGTRRECRVGDPSCGLIPCRSKTCSLCSIIRESFKLSKAGSAPGRNFLRFGRGIYTTSVSSKADDYNAAQPNSSFKAMLVANVLLGKGAPTLKTCTTMTKPPDGYDSVLGLVGVDLNYDEQVVYKEDAIRPAYLIIYKP